jgi:hypothetical protein
VLDLVHGGLRKNGPLQVLCNLVVDIPPKACKNIVCS